jgi:1,4-dihydroxy-2-naphthoyl-CoA synthase
MPEFREFMYWSWEEDLCAHVTLKVKDYTPTTIDELEDVIQDLRIQSRSMIIIVDLTGANPFCHEVRQITKLILDVFEYTKHDQLLTQIQFKNAGFLVRSFYGPISMMLPGYVREIIVFI